MRPELTHLPTEPYPDRHTQHLLSWEDAVFGKHFEMQALVPNVPTQLSINTGEVLDATNRPIWAMKQMQMLLERPERDLGSLWFSDFYHTGLDALAYSRRPFKAFSFCWAQSFDRFDFTRKMLPWMRQWEFLACELYAGVFVASTLLADLFTTAMPQMEGRVHVVGLPFNSKHVRSLLSGEELKSATTADAFDVVYTSRWDAEKNPRFFLSLVNARPNLRFAVCTGATDLRGDPTAIAEARRLEADGRLTIFRACTKAQYYSVLSRSKAQFNCGLQDWVSYTLLEALTFGCLPLYPNWRSFPETFFYEQEFLYRPGDLQDAIEKLDALLQDATRLPKVGQRILEVHDGALERIAQAILNSR